MEVLFESSERLFSWQSLLTDIGIHDKLGNCVETGQCLHAKQALSLGLCKIYYRLIQYSSGDYSLKSTSLIFYKSKKQTYDSVQKKEIDKIWIATLLMHTFQQPLETPGNVL